MTSIIINSINTVEENETPKKKKDVKRKEIVWTHLDFNEMIQDALDDYIDYHADDEEEYDVVTTQEIKVGSSELEREQRMGDTNFDITDYMLDIALADGVDEFRAISRYRFCIIIGKQFSFKDVRKNVENCINK